MSAISTTPPAIFRQHNSAMSVASVSHRRPENVTPLHAEMLGETHAAHTCRSTTTTTTNSNNNPLYLGSTPTTITTTAATNATTPGMSIGRYYVKPLSTPTAVSVAFSPSLSTALALPGPVVTSMPSFFDKSSNASSFGSSAVVRGDDTGSSSHTTTPKLSQQQLMSSMPLLNGTPQRNSSSQICSPGGHHTGPHRVSISTGDLSSSDGAVSPQDRSSSAHPSTIARGWSQSVMTPQLLPSGNPFNVSITQNHFNNSMTNNPAHFSAAPTTTTTAAGAGRRMPLNTGARIGDFAAEAATATSGRRSTTLSVGGHRPPSCVAVGSSSTPYHRNALMSPACLGRASLTAPPTIIRDVRLDDTIPVFVEQTGDLRMALDRFMRLTDVRLSEIMAKLAVTQALMVDLMSVVNKSHEQHDVPPTRSGSALSLRSSPPSSNDTSNMSNINTDDGATGLEKRCMPEGPTPLRCPSIAPRRNSSATMSIDDGLLRHALRKCVAFLCELLISWLIRVRAAAATTTSTTTTTTTTPAQLSTTVGPTTSVVVVCEEPSSTRSWMHLLVPRVL
jgi:hypothetical protein